MTREFFEKEYNQDRLVTNPRVIAKTLELSPKSVKRLYVTSNFLHKHFEWKKKLSGISVPYRICSTDVLNSYTRDHAGIIAVLEDTKFISLESFLEKVQDKKDSLITVFDKITDVGNFNAMVRTAYACGVDGIIIPKVGATTNFQSSLHGSAGAVLSIDLIKVTNISRALENLKKIGYWIVGTDSHSNSTFWEHSFSEKVVLVVGSEEKGVRSNILKACDFVVSIPSVNKIDSLNVSVSFGVMLYEILRQKKSLLKL